MGDATNTQAETVPTKGLSAQGGAWVLRMAAFHHRKE